MHSRAWRERWQPPVIEHNKLTPWNWMVSHPENLTLGKCVDIGAFTYIECLEGVRIGNDVEIGSHCAIYTRSTIDNKSGPVQILRGARIGCHTTIMPGVTIGERAVVGAHSFVTRSIPAGAIAWGVPATVQGRRDMDARS